MRDNIKRALSNTTIAVIGACGLATVSPQPAMAKNDCVAHAAEAERELGIPAGILTSIAMVESGADGAPQPFAMNIAGRAIIARSVEDAARRLRDAKGRLRSNAYIGCMQISLQVHKSQFDRPEQIVVPRENVRYAGRLLLRLHEEEGNWRSAIARYNGAPIRAAQNYVCKVWRHLNDLEDQSARLIESANCQDGETSISPRTRRSYKNAQVAQIN